MTPKKTYVSVILPLKLDWMPCYSLPEGTNARPGDWVKVVFANRTYSGIIAKYDIIPDTEPSKIKDVTGVCTNLSPVTAEEIRLWEMVADYYLCSIGEVFKAAYPALKISQEETLARMQERERAKREKLAENISLKIGKLEERLDRKRKKLEESENSAKKKEKTIAGLLESIEKISDEIIGLKGRLEEISASYYGTGESIGPEGGKTAGPDTGTGNMPEILLTEAQETVYRQVLTAFSQGKPVLVKGVTGSGKTEIYLKMAQRIMSEGKNILYLVPEIAVSRQLERRLQAIFGDRVLTFHSEMTAAARRNAAEKIRRSRSEGRQYMVLGTRSAIFLPHMALGLIVVDEEHESSYKQDSPAPRYNGRDAAVMLSTIHGCPIMMGSATPSLESVFNAGCGKYFMLTLDAKYYSAAEAATEIIDTTAERRKRGMTGSFSKKLISRIEETLGNREQVLILRSRRAFSTVLQCPECGEIVKCPHCNVSLSLHRNPDRMVCRHCGFTAAFNSGCPKCGATLQGLGSGTQRIEEETRALFPSARISRLDSDTPKTEAADIINRFNSGETDILIGTQIVSKGFDFPGLTLAAVIAADSLLGIQDFRADEKAFQCLEQLRGRCGRRDKQGTFIIQTSQPDHPVYRQLTEGDSSTFYTELMAERREFGYPPFTRLVNLCIRDRDEPRAETLAARLAEALGRAFAEAGADNLPEIVSGPFPPPVDRIAGNYIRIIRLTLKKDRRLHDMKRLAATTAANFEKAARCQGSITIDVDPY